MNREKVIKKTKDDIRTGYLDDESGEFILHSVDDEPAIIWSDGTKYWFINNKEYYNKYEYK